MSTKSELFEKFTHDLAEMEDELKVICKNSERIYNRTTRVIRTVFTVIGLLVVVNLYFIYDFGRDVLSMIGYMNDMYQHFGRVTENVDYMTKDVVKMGANIELMPEIANKMQSMNQHVGSMASNVEHMQGNVSAMNQDVSSINDDMTSMSYRFNQVNQTVGNMSYNVREMSDTIPR